MLLTCLFYGSALLCQPMCETLETFVVPFVCYDSYRHLVCARPFNGSCKDTLSAIAVSPLCPKGPFGNRQDYPTVLPTEHRTFCYDQVNCAFCSRHDRMRVRKMRLCASDVRRKVTCPSKRNASEMVSVSPFWNFTGWKARNIRFH